MPPFERNLAIRLAVLDVMKQGGCYRRIMDSGPELDRVKAFLLRMSAREHGEHLPKQHPTFLPIFPGLRNVPMRSPTGDPVADYLRAATPRIRDEALRLRERRLSFAGGIVTDGTWLIYPLWYMGTTLPFMTAHCRDLRRIASAIPRCALSHPFAEALLSWQEPHTHLGAHCSVDSLRLRYSVGVIVDQACSLRVGQAHAQWQVGESIVFEDCFEHEAWNGPASRLVFIIDTWHPDLRPIEREALAAMFRKREVRSILCEFRMSEPMRPFLQQRFAEEDRDPLLARYWDAGVAIVAPSIQDWGTWNTVPVFS